MKGQLRLYSEISSSAKKTPIHFTVSADYESMYWPHCRSQCKKYEKNNEEKFYSCVKQCIRGKVAEEKERNRGNDSDEVQELKYEIE